MLPATIERQSCYAYRVVHVCLYQAYLASNFFLRPEANQFLFFALSIQQSIFIVLRAFLLVALYCWE